MLTAVLVPSNFNFEFTCSSKFNSIGYAASFPFSKFSTDLITQLRGLKTSSKGNSLIIEIDQS